MKQAYLKMLSLFFLLSMGLGCVPMSTVGAEEIVVKSLDERAASWINYKSDMFFEKSDTKVHLHIEIDKQTKKIALFQINTEWGKINIPQKILLNIDKPQINTIDMSYTPIEKENPDWRFSLRLYFGEYCGNCSKNNEEFSQIQISFDKNSILNVTVFDIKED